MNLVELKNLRPQLYSASEYYEKSYLNTYQKQIRRHLLPRSSPLPGLLSPIQSSPHRSHPPPTLQPSSPSPPTSSPSLPTALPPGALRGPPIRGRRGHAPPPGRRQGVCALRRGGHRGHAPANGKDASPPPRPRPPPPPAGPALPGNAEEYVCGSIEASLGLPVPDRSLRAKLAASEDLRRRLQDRVFTLEEDLHAAARRIDLLRNELAMNAEGIQRCVEEKEAVATARDQLAAHAARLEKECVLYEHDLERAMESCDELARESDDLRKCLRDAPDVTALNNEVEALQRDKEILRTNLNKAEEETLPLAALHAPPLQLCREGKV
ncbi:programmed cell death protein 7-like [Triticum dicoccoides]|uniref:programmed cell death protein 7-like n=1 Tax=Triticum dicoccoides TaxID=85692 RepID=UPI0018917F98|nr:programmed cell death protein 7-like [Triticum dicoccoides]